MITEPLNPTIIWLNKLNETLLGYLYKYTPLHRYEYSYNNTNEPMIFISIKTCRPDTLEIFNYNYKPPEIITFIINGNTLLYTHGSAPRMDTISIDKWVIIKKYDISDPDSNDLLIADIIKIITAYEPLREILLSMQSVLESMKSPPLLL